MSKQKQTPGRASVDRAPDQSGREAESAAPELDPVLVEQAALGNAAIQQKIGAASGSEDPLSQVGLDVVRDVAFPMVERALLSLQLTPRDSGQVARFLDILERSHLPGERRDALMERIRTDQAAALGIQEALVDCFGGDDDDLRDHVGETLEGVWGGLLTGRTGPGDTWTLDAGDVIALSPAVHTGTLAERAEAFVGDLAGTLATGPVRERAQGDVGRAVTRFCRAVSLALVLDEDEDEDDLVESFDFNG